MSLYLVTGGCGFIGSHLVDTLIEQGHFVRVLDNLSTGKKENLHEDAELIIGDITNANMVSSAIEDMDGIFHLAAIPSVEASHEHWVRTHETNLTATLNIFNTARKRCIPVVYASSAAVYGANSDLPLSEKSSSQPLSAYGADKLGCELHGKVAREVYQLPTLGLRFFNVYGPRQDPHSPYSGVISTFANRLATGQELILHGDGSQSRDFIFVKDITMGLTKSMTKLEKKGLAAPEKLNLCTGNRTTILRLAETMKKVWKSEVDISYHNSRLGDILHSLGDPTMSKNELKFIASTALTEGLQHLHDNFTPVPDANIIALPSATIST